MSALDSEPFPRPLLLGAAALVIGTLAITGLARYGQPAEPPKADQAVAPAPLAALELTIVDRPDGSVGLLRHPDGQEVFTLAPGEDGFVRSVMRGLARERRGHGLGAAEPFRLAQLPDGRLTLTDLATGRQLELGAFGPTNRAAFARILAQPRTAP